MSEQSEKPLPPALRWLRVAFAGFLVLALAFSVLMAAWGDLRDALFVRILDTRYSKSFVFRAPEGAKVWLGDKYLGVAARPVIAEGEPDAVIDGLAVAEARVYAEEALFLKQALVIEPGSGSDLALAKLAPGRRVLTGGGIPLQRDGQSHLVVLAEDNQLDAALLCTVSIPRREGGSTLFALLLRTEYEGRRLMEPCTISARTMQLQADNGSFWTTRSEYEGLPPRVTGQLRTSWLFWTTPADAEAQISLLHGLRRAEARWVELPESR